LHWFQQSQQSKNKCSHELMSVTHKVSDHQLHREWKSLAASTSHWLHQLLTVCVYKCIDNNNLFKAFEHNFFCLQKSTSWVFITFLESFFLSIYGYWKSSLLRQLPFTSKISSTPLDYWELEWYRIKGKELHLLPKSARTCCFFYQICGIWYTPKNTRTMKNQVDSFHVHSLFSSLEKCEEARDNIRRNSISQPFVSATLGLRNHPLSCNWISHYTTDDVLSL
jgi:hypothetical protein